MNARRLKKQRENNQKGKIIRHQKHLLKKYRKQTNVDVNYLLKHVKSAPSAALKRKGKGKLDTDDILIVNQQREIDCYKTYLENQQTAVFRNATCNNNASSNQRAAYQNYYAAPSQQVPSSDVPIEKVTKSKRNPKKKHASQPTMAPVYNPAYNGNTNNNLPKRRASKSANNRSNVTSQSTQATAEAADTRDTLDAQYAFREGAPPDRIVVPRGYFRRVECFGCGVATDPDRSTKRRRMESRTGPANVEADARKAVWDDVGRARDRWSRRNPGDNPYRRADADPTYDEPEPMRRRRDPPYYRRRPNTFRGYDDGRTTSVGGVVRRAAPHDRCALGCDGRDNCNLCAANHYLYM